MRSRLHVIISLWIELTRELSIVDRPRKRRRTVNIRDHLITAAVYLGTVEHRKMTASRLAKELGMARTTVLRRLAVLEKVGTVERRGLTWRTPLRALMRMERVDLEAIAAKIRASAAKLE